MADTIAAPDDHFAASPDCRVTVPGGWREESATRYPTVYAGIVLPAGVHIGGSPPQTIISLPVHTAVCPHRPSGALVLLVAIQLSVPGLYRPPVFK